MASNFLGLQTRFSAAKVRTGTALLAFLAFALRTANVHAQVTFGPIGSRRLHSPRSAMKCARAGDSRSLQLLLLTVYATLCLAQGPQPGTPSFSPIEGHEYYSINLQTFSINVTAPIRSKAGFGTYALAGTSQITAS